MKGTLLFLPHVFVLLVGMAVFLGLARFAKHRLSASLPLMALELGLILVATLLILVILTGFAPDSWLRARTEADWRQRAGEVDCAIVLGFGYQKGANGAMLPGAANRALLDFALSRTFPAITTLYVQEGVWAAKCSTGQATCTVVSADGRSVELKRIHKHDPDVYVSTLDAAYCAMDAMAAAGKRSTVLITHDLQLARAVWAFEEVRLSRSDGDAFTFITPFVPTTPFVEPSAHFWTQGPRVWKRWELFVSRPKDFFSPSPERCKLP